MVSNKDPKLVFLMKTKVEKNTFDIANIFVVRHINRGGGLALLWKFDIALDIQTYSNRHIDTIIDHGVDNA